MSALSHRQAWDIIADAWRDVHGRSPTYKEALYALAIAYLETGYGRVGQFGALADRGQYNWGALERGRNADGSCPPGTAPGSDVGSVCFYVYPSDRAAAAAFLRTLTTRHWPVIAAMRGSPEDVARAMRVPPPYYAGYADTEEGKVADYAGAIRARVAEIARQVPSTVPGGSWLPTLVVLGGLAAIGYGYVKTYGAPSWAPDFIQRIGARA